MKNERLFTGFWAMVLSWCAAMGGLGMMTTGLGLRVDLLPLGLLCLLCTAVLCIVMHFRYGGWCAAALWGILWLLPELRLGLKALGRTIFNYMSMAYGYEIPRWLLDRRPQSLLPVMLMLGTLTIIVWLSCILKGRTVAGAIGVLLVPLICCITVTDTVPHSIWLYLWLLAPVLLLLTQVARRESAAKGNRLTLMVLVPAVLALWGMFLLIPEKNANDWDLMGVLERMSEELSFGEGQGGKELELASSAERVPLNTLGSRNVSTRKVMEVTADYSGLLYLRGRDYDKYTGTAWFASQGRSELLYPPTNSVEQGNVHIQTRSGKDYYYVPCYSGRALTLQDGILANEGEKREYDFPVCALSEGWQYSAGGAAVADRDNLSLPAQTLSDAREYLKAAGLSAGDTVTEKAEFIRGLVADSATYDLDTKRMPADHQDLAMWFLKEGETGYCVHFATAAAVLLRAADIPARYVEGYMTQVVAGQTVSVVQRQAHAWVEYYVNGVGWVILEATPAAGVSNTAEPPASAEPTQPSEEPTEPSTDPTDPTDPTQESTEPTTEPTEETTTPVTEPTEPTQKPTEPGTQPSPEVPEPEKGRALWLLIPIAAILAVTAVILQYRLRRRRKHRRLSHGNANARGLACYREMCRLSAYLNLPVPRKMTAIAEKAKFSNRTLTSEETDCLFSFLAQLRLQLRNLPLYKRWAAKWIWVFD